MIFRHAPAGRMRKMEQREAVVSVVVPVYKTEKYLDACVKSILRQDYPALEILLIDDG